jgi:hypothetical protein
MFHHNKTEKQPYTLGDQYLYGSQIFFVLAFSLSVLRPHNQNERVESLIDLVE